VEQHGRELYEDNGEEEEYQHDTDWFQVKVFFGNDDLKRTKMTLS